MRRITRTCKLVTLIVVMLLMYGCALKPSFNQSVMPDTTPNVAPQKIMLDDDFNISAPINKKTKLFRMKYKRSLGHVITAPKWHGMAIEWTSQDNIILYCGGKGEENVSAYIVLPSTNTVEKVEGGEKDMILEELRAKFTIEDNEEKLYKTGKEVGREILRYLTPFNIKGSHNYNGKLNDRGYALDLVVNEKYKIDDDVVFWKEVSMKVANNSTEDTYEYFFEIDEDDQLYATELSHTSMFDAWLKTWNISPNGKFIMLENLNDYDEGNAIMLMDPSVQKKKGIIKRRFVVDIKNAFVNVVTDYFYIDYDISPSWDRIAFLNGRTNKDKYWEYYIEIYPFDKNSVDDLKDLLQVKN